MAKNNAINLDVNENADGFDLSGGTTQRKLTLTGADITLTGTGSNTYTYPNSSDTLVGRDSTDTLTNKTINTASNTITITASDVSDFDTEVANETSVTANTSARHTQNTDTALGSGAVAADHGTDSTDQIVNVSYGTSATPPTASTTTEGSLYVQYTA